MLSVALFAALLYINSNNYPGNHIGRVLGEDKLKTEITGVVKSPALTRKPYYGKINSTYLFEIEKLGNKTATGLLRIRVQSEKDYAYGDKLVLAGTIKRPRKAGDNEFDYRGYLERQNIFALINTKQDDVTVLARDYRSNLILRYVYSFREKLKDRIIAKMPLESGAFLRAILLGHRSELPERIRGSFRNSGTMHILPTQCRGKYSYSLKSHVTLYKSIG
jgi:hypothetical protein